MGEQRAVAVQPAHPNISLFGPIGEREQDSANGFRVAARARFKVDPTELAVQLEGQLWAAAELVAITEDKVVNYCKARGLMHPRLELAVLREAHTIVAPARVIERLLHDVDQHLQRAGNAEISLLLNDSHLRHTPDRLAEACVASGTLSVSGTVTLPQGDRRSADYHIETNWLVVRGEPRGSFVERAGSLFVEPLASAVGIVAARALSDVQRALPLVVRAALHNPSTPTFARVERLLRIGRLTHQTRVTLLYWKRLRDYMIWDVTR